MEGTMGEIRMFAGNFAPKNWALCSGTTMAISQNQALYSILGTIYGGDGRTTFALPDLRGRVPVQQGRGPGLTNRVQGQPAGAEAHIMNTQQLARHTHAATFTSGGGGGAVSVEIDVASANGTTADPNGNIIAQVPGGLGSANAYAAPSAKSGTLGGVTASGGGGGGGTVTVDDAGDSAQFSLMQPFLPINFIICIEGNYPSRN